MTFTVPIFIKLTITQQHWAEIFCAEFPVIDLEIVKKFIYFLKLSKTVTEKIFKEFTFATTCC